MRKIKLMALLLAALMIVTAFAGCAGVKQEVVDDLDDRVSKIEDLLLQQNDTIGNLADKIENGGSNDDVLAAIESMNKDLSDKIDELEGRVEDVENKPAVGGTDTNVQAKQTEALASIAVQKAEFNKNAAEYDDDSFAAITSAFAKAEATVTAATTEAEVKAAMDALATTLDSYKTYAMKLYDFYIALLGNINDDAEQLVEDALDFIDIVDDVYADLDYTEKEKVEELEYVVAEATTTTRAKTLDVYNSVKALCEIFESTNTAAGLTDVQFEYVDAKGNVKTFTGALTLAGYKDQAKKIVRDIKNIIGEDGLTYETLLKVDKKASDYTGTTTSFVKTGDNADKKILALLQDTYADYVESAEFVGGEKLVALVTNADLLVNTADAAEKLYDAVDAYKELNGRVSGTYQDGFYYYTDVANKADGLVIADPDDAEEVLFLDEFYTEKVDELIADWVDEFDLTAEDAAAIIDKIEGEDFYKDYLQLRRKVALVAEAYNEFVKNIVPGIKTLNKLSSKSADAVEDFNELKEAVEALYTLQVADKKSEDVADQIDITLDAVTFEEFVKQSGVVYVNDVELYQIEEADDDDVEALIETLNNGRVADVTAAITTLETIDAEDFVELFTFAADIKELDKNATGNTDDYIALRTTGEKYNFFAVEFGKAEEYANNINAAIAYLVYKVENNKISSDEDFVKLAGEYVTLGKANADFEIVYKNGTAAADDDVVFTNAGATANGSTDTSVKDTLYVASADAINYAEDYEDFDPLTSAVTDGVYVDLLTMDENEKVSDDEVSVLTIEFFNYAFPTFVSLIDVEAFEDAKETAETRIKALFDDIDELKAILEEVAYVRGTAYEYKDLNGNGKNDGGKEMPYDTNGDGLITEGETWPEPIDVNTVSLNDKAKFDGAVKIYDAWVFAGGNESLKLFAEKLDDEGESYGGLYEMEGFKSTDGVGAVLTTLRNLNDKFTTLVTLANNFTGAVKLVGDVNSYNSITAAKLDGKTSNNIDRWAITEFKNSDNTSDHSGINGDWKFVTLSSDGSLTTDVYKDTSSTSTSGVAVNLSADSEAPLPLSKEALLKAVVAYYTAFETANIEYVAASNNDYDDDETFNFYANKGYDAYKAVDDAKATYEKYDLIAAKGACLNAISSVVSDAATTFKGHVTSATTLAALDNAIANYISVGGTAPDLVGWTIYEFDSISD